MSVVDGPEGHPPPSQPFCDHDNPENTRHFVHDLNMSGRLLVHRAGHTVAPAQALFVFDHFQLWNDCGLAYALVSDPVGRLPVTMGHGGTYTFIWEDGAVAVDGPEGPPQEGVVAGESVSLTYNQTEASGSYELRYDGAFDVEHLGSWSFDRP